MTLPEIGQAVTYYEEFTENFSQECEICLGNGELYARDNGGRYREIPCTACNELGYTWVNTPHKRLNKAAVVEIKINKLGCFVTLGNRAVVKLENIVL